MQCMYTGSWHYVMKLLRIYIIHVYISGYGVSIMKGNKVEVEGAIAFANMLRVHTRLMKFA